MGKTRNDRRKYYDNIYQAITTQALEFEKEISTIAEVDKDTIEYSAAKNIEGPSQQSTDDSNILTFKIIYINNQDDNIKIAYFYILGSFL